MGTEQVWLYSMTLHTRGWLRAGFVIDEPCLSVFEAGISDLSFLGVETGI